MPDNFTDKIFKKDLYKRLNLMLKLFLVLCFLFLGSMHAQETSLKWVGTWSTAPQLVEPGNNPPQPGLSNNTLRQIVHVSIGGDSLRLRFTNEFSNSPVTLNEVHIAVSEGNGIIDAATDKKIYFNGEQNVTMAPGSAVMSDPFQFTLEPLTDVAITIYFGSTSPDVTGHPGSRTTSYILTGNQAAITDFSSAVKTDHWYVINTIEVLAPEQAAAVAIIGNSITDGRGSGTNKQNRWPDELARRLQANPETRLVAVLNEGIGGNCVLRGCLGPSALSRLERDVLNQNGVKWLIIFEGVNDIGGAFGAQGSAQVAQDLIAAYNQMIDSAHERGIIVYGATILPFNGSSYYSTDHENARQTVNEWIRNSGRFDAVIDLDKALRDPNNPLRLLPSADTGDHLHPNENGHRLMAEAVDLTLFGATPPVGITITRSDIEEYFEQGKKRTYMHSDRPQTSMEIGTADSIPQNWFWPDVLYEDTTVSIGVDPSFTPFASEFPEATHAEKTSGVYFDDETQSNFNTDSYQFYRITDTSMISLGSADYVQGLGIKKDIEYDNTISLKLPMMYGEEFVLSNDTVSVSETILQVETETKFIDAFGTIDFNGGTYDALRVKTEEQTDIYENGSLLTTTTQRTYTWYTKSEGIAELDADTSSVTSGEVPAYELFLLIPGDLTTDVPDYAANSPENFLVLQNYPNPFNPVTNFEFRIPAVGDGSSDFTFVTLRIYDILGREVTTLVNEEKAAGTYKIQFDASHLSSGIYYCRLTAGNSSLVKKMVLMK